MGCGPRRAGGGGGAQRGGAVIGLLARGASRQVRAPSVSLGGWYHDHRDTGHTSLLQLFQYFSLHRQVNSLKQ